MPSRIAAPCPLELSGEWVSIPNDSNGNHCMDEEEESWLINLSSSLSIHCNISMMPVWSSTVYDSLVAFTSHARTMPQIIKLPTSLPSMLKEDSLVPMHDTAGLAISVQVASHHFRDENTCDRS